MPDRSTFGGVFATSRPLVFLNLAGTLSSHVADPSKMLVSQEVSEAVEAVANRYTCAVLTGNSCAVARSLLTLETVLYVGVYGAEGELPGRRPWRFKDFFREGHDVVALLERWRDMLVGAGAVLQLQGDATVQIHWGHQVGERATAVRTLAQQFAEAAIRDGFAVEELSASLDVRPRRITKAFGLDELIRRTGPFTGVLAMGDDDVDVFQRLSGLREATDSPVSATYCVGVLHQGRLQPVLGKADDYVHGVDPEVPAYLWRVAEP